MARRKLYFDERRLNPDSLDILEASALLEVTEFEFFKLAYRWWHGRDIGDRRTEAHYLPYMFRDQVPLWVRQFARHVLAEEEAGRLDPARYGVHPRPVSQRMIDRGLRYCLWLVVVMAVFLTMLGAYEHLAPATPACYLPPCV